jgi:hypothetical protein
MFNSTPTFPGIDFSGGCLLSFCVYGLLETPRLLTTPRQYGNGLSVLAQSEIRHLTYATSCRTSGLHSLDARLAIEHLSWPTIIDSGTWSRPTLSAPEPTLLILGSHSCRLGSHSLTPTKRVQTQQACHEGQ